MITAIKPHILLLNKMDLCDLRERRTIVSRLMNDGVNKVIYTDCHLGYGIVDILPAVIELSKSSDRFNRADCDDFNLLVIGIPNVGKSSLINRMRNLNIHMSSVARVGKSAGVTRSVMERIKISKNPPVYLYDTPGILEPKFNWNSKNGLETIMRCALCATVSDEVIGAEIIADYLLYWLNRHDNFSYVQFLGLDHASDDITEVLTKGAVYFNHMNTVREMGTHNDKTSLRPNLNHTAITFVKAFRNGKFGRVLLDDDMI